MYASDSHEVGVGDCKRGRKIGLIAMFLPPPCLRRSLSDLQSNLLCLVVLNYRGLMSIMVSLRLPPKLFSGQKLYLG